MANTYTQLFIHVIFTVNGRTNLIFEENRQELEKYICGIITAKQSKPLAIFCNPDHVHILIGLHPDVSVSSLVRDIKANSTRFINQQNCIRGKFSWQIGFGAFSYSKSQVDTVVKYILNQPEHHRKHTFMEEYISFLEKYNIEYKDQYLFE